MFWTIVGALLFVFVGIPIILGILFWLFYGIIWLFIIICDLITGKNQK